MTEENKFKPIGIIHIYGDGIGKVTLYDASHANESEEQRIWTVTTIASLAYGNEEAKNPKALYERMKSIKHESLWEFIRIGTASFRDLYSSMRNHSNFGTGTSYPYSHGDSIALHKTNIACFRIKVPIFVARQFMRHRSFSYLEMSRRYTKDAKAPFEFWFPKEFYTEDSSDKARQALCTSWINDYQIISAKYHTQIASRFLPQTTYTEFYVMGEVEGLRNFFRLRLDEHAQAEIREVAEAMMKLLENHQPELASKCRGD